ncbi:MAG: fumarylacetoacetate hydrolase family protein, partial [Bacteroidota bacterium]
MKLIRFGAAGQEKPGYLDSTGAYRDASSLVPDFNESFWRNGGIETLERLIAEAGELPVISPEERLGPPIARPSKIVCVGLNYADHARESGMEPPREPVVFFKATTAICGPFDQITLPPGSEKSDWEVELAVVIGKEAKHVSEE